jgi:hypothetical protein
MCLCSTKRHQSRLCPNKVVTCPNLGCGHRLHLQNLRWHLQEECSYATQRKQLMEQATRRKVRNQEVEEMKREQFRQAKSSATVLVTNLSQRENGDVSKSKSTKEPMIAVCPECGEAMRESQLSTHRRESCPSRCVMCPNFGLGCNERKIPLHLIRDHLAKDCHAELLKTQLVGQCYARHAEVMCSTCGEQVELRHLRQHDIEKCPNRLVHCRNHHLGCPVMVPLRERHLHEQINENYERFCMFFPGHGGCLQLNESDVLEPWTVEVKLLYCRFWIFLTVLFLLGFSFGCIVHYHKKLCAYTFATFYCRSAPMKLLILPRVTFTTKYNQLQMN